LFTVLLKSQRKRSWNKVEIFDCRYFGYYASRVDKYRIRVNGKWFPPKSSKTFYSKKEIMRLIEKSIRFYD
jgi:hypothetical protein